MGLIGWLFGKNRNTGKKYPRIKCPECDNLYSDNVAKCKCGFKFSLIPQEKYNPEENCIEILPTKHTDTLKTIKYSHTNIIAQAEKRSNKQFIPNEIDLENIPYEPLPPTPNVWEVKSNYFKELHSDTDLFSVFKNSNLRITKNIKMEKEEKPDTFYNEVRFSSGGTLFIDKNGKNNKRVIYFYLP